MTNKKNDGMNDLIKDHKQYRHIYDPDTIGIEIEMEGAGLEFGSSRTWSMVRDGSLRGNPESIEYVLTRPIGLTMTSRAINNLQNLLVVKRKAKLNPSERCGVHIHFNIQHYTRNDLLTFICMYLVVEKLLLHYCGETREGNLFCLRASDAEYIITRLIEYKKNFDLYRLTRDAGKTKYGALNLGSIGQHGSLEFRSLLTPKNLNDIEEWIQILNKIRQFAAKYKTQISIVEDISALGVVAFVKRMFGQQLYNKLVKNSGFHIEEEIYMGVHLIQDIAYTETGTLKKKETGKKIDPDWWEQGDHIVEPPPRQRMVTIYQDDELHWHLGGTNSQYEGDMDHNRYQRHTIQTAATVISEDEWQRVFDEPRPTAQPTFIEEQDEEEQVEPEQPIDDRPRRFNPPRTAGNLAHTAWENIVLPPEDDEE